MAAPLLSAALRGAWSGRAFSTAAALCKRAAPLGPMPNEDIDVSNLEALEKYRSFTRYFKLAEKESRKPRWWKTYRQYTNPEPEPKTDISLPRDKVLRVREVKERKRILKQNHQNIEMERAARLRTALIPLDEVRAEWEKTSGPFHKQRLAEHCGIFRDLLQGATFTPWVGLKVGYNQEDEHLVPVYYGNVVTPSEASNPPEVSYEADKGSLWTLLLTNPDGHLRDTDSEYLHWLVTNIPGNDIKAGKEMCHYLPPFPAMGTGYHRFIFLLFKQDRPIDFSEDVRPKPCYSLKMRTFSTFDFYRKHEDDMTPAGLAFFQCQWDSSVTWIFHQLLNMREPVFEFVRPPVYHPPQLKFPRRQPLRYLDRYRDSEEPTYGIY
ncbi:39S ribosomal protein L38, mitochondrial isoform X2 [Tympanuchus pallidicinctus]|uniref:39S ribosomal protein L38, mitochondrial isoform X2 n=1 Tax=Tympanuchus pallidicinctus TaxID=109042 RepID=UPI002286F2C7|nr:39S ribosomal protein L38, mitochondrial isoform X2 [Tympanuchus pallidicinctus]